MPGAESSPQQKFLKSAQTAYSINPTVIGELGTTVEIDENSTSAKCSQQWFFLEGGLSAAKSGSVTWDMWSWYNRIPNVPGMQFQRLTVNYCENFVDPQTSAHTQINCWVATGITKSQKQQRIWDWAWLVRFISMGVYLKAQEQGYGPFLTNSNSYSLRPILASWIITSSVRIRYVYVSLG